MRYAVIIEKGESGFGFYIRDLLGCIVAGEPREEVLQLIKEAVEFHLEELPESGELIPEP